jgi:hypothetical protein
MRFADAECGLCRVVRQRRTPFGRFSGDKTANCFDLCRIGAASQPKSESDRAGENSPPNDSEIASDRLGLCGLERASRLRLSPWCVRG